MVFGVGCRRMHPQLNKRSRPYLKPVNKSYRIDETYIKVKGEDKYLYRALDSTGQTCFFQVLWSANPDLACAKAIIISKRDRLMY